METVSINNKLFTKYINETEIQHRIGNIHLELAEKYKNKKPLFIIVLRGAFMFAADILKHYNTPCDIEFVKLSSYEGMESSGKIKMDLPISAEKIKNRDIIIIEDIIDSGLTMYFFKEYLQSFSPASIFLVSFLFKPENLKKEIAIDIIGFTIPNLFVIGYGLDYDGEGRNLASVYQLKEN